MSDRNRNRPGYKKTKIGWIPEEWKLQYIDQLCSFSNGNGFSESEWSSTGLPIIRIQNLNGNQQFKYFDGTPKKKWIIDQGNLLFAWAGVKGVSFGPKIWRGPKGVLNQHIYKITLNKSHEKSWFFYIMIRVTEEIEKKAHGFKSTLLHVQKRDITKQHVPIPPLPEQKKIAEILSTWDRAIEQTRGLVEAKKKRRKCLMQQLLTGKIRLEGHASEWLTYRLGDLFKERNETNGIDLPLLAITGNRGIIPASDIVRKDSSNEDKSRYKKILIGDIGYNTMRMWQGVSAVSGLNGIVSPAYTICIPQENVVVQFMGYFFKYAPIIQLFWSYSQGLVADTLNLKYHSFAQIKVTIPDCLEQQAIAQVLQTADQEINQLETKLQALEKQKRGLMQKLLTGEIRVAT